MTTAKLSEIYSEILSGIHGLEETDRNAVLKCIDRNEYLKNTEISFYHLSNAAIICKEEISKSFAKEAGVSDAVKAAKAIMKRCPDSKPIGMFAHDNNGIQEISDYFSVAVRMKNPLPLPIAPKFDASYMNLENIMKVSSEDYNIELPTIAELKAHIADIKAKHKAGLPLKDTEARSVINGSTKINVLWEFGPTMPLVNAQYLVEVMTMMQGNIHATSNVKNNKVTLTDDAGNCGIIMGYWRGTNHE